MNYSTIVNTSRALLLVLFVKINYSTANNCEIIIKKCITNRNVLLILLADLPIIPLPFLQFDANHQYTLGDNIIEIVCSNI